MLMYLFVSTARPSIRAFTSDRTGTNLPRDYAPWEASGTPISANGTADTVTRAIERDGFFLVSSFGAESFDRKPKVRSERRRATGTR
jgi:hypothetical protein